MTKSQEKALKRAANEMNLGGRYTTKTEERKLNLFVIYIQNRFNETLVANVNISKRGKIQALSLPSWLKNTKNTPFHINEYTEFESYWYKTLEC